MGIYFTLRYLDGKDVNNWYRLKKQKDKYLLEAAWKEVPSSEKEYLPELKSVLADAKAELKRLKAEKIDEYSSDYMEHVYRIQDITEGNKELSKRIRDIQKQVKYYDEIKEQIYAL